MDKIASKLSIDNTLALKKDEKVIKEMFEMEQCDSVYNEPDIPVLNGSLDALFPRIGMSSPLILPVKESDIENESYKAFREREVDPEHNSEFDEMDYFNFLDKRNEILDRGLIRVDAKRIKYDLIRVSTCIKKHESFTEGYRKHSGTYILGYINLDGKFVSPLALYESDIHLNLWNWFKLNQNPLDENGQLKEFPFKTFKSVFIPIEYYKVFKDGCFGIVDKQFQVIIPVQYKEIIIDSHNLMIVTSDNIHWGLIDLSHTFKIPPEYTFLQYDKRSYRGYYIAEKDGMVGIVSKDHRIIKPFKKTNLERFLQKIYF